MANTDLDGRSKWMRMGMSRAFVLWMEESNKWTNFKKAYEFSWKDAGGLKSGKTQRAVAEEAWLDFKTRCPALPPDVQVFDRAPVLNDGRFDMGASVAVSGSADGSDAPNALEGSTSDLVAIVEAPVVLDDDGESAIYELESDVDFFQQLLWAWNRAETKAKDIRVWRSQGARKLHRLIRQEPMAIMKLFAEKIAGQTVVDRGGKEDDGTAESTLIEEILKAELADGNK